MTKYKLSILYFYITEELYMKCVLFLSYRLCTSIKCIDILFAGGNAMPKFRRIASMICLLITFTYPNVSYATTFDQEVSAHHAILMDASSKARSEERRVGK